MYLWIFLFPCPFFLLLPFPPFPSASRPGVFIPDAIGGTEQGKYQSAVVSGSGEADKDSHVEDSRVWRECPSGAETALQQVGREPAVGVRAWAG